MLLKYSSLISALVAGASLATVANARGVSNANECRDDPTFVFDSEPNLLDCADLNPGSAFCGVSIDGETVEEAFCPVSCGECDVTVTANSVSASKSSYALNEDIVISFTNIEPEDDDWIAIYPVDTLPTNLATSAPLWYYGCGNRIEKCTSLYGSLTFGATAPDAGDWPLTVGDYYAVMVRESSAGYPYSAYAESSSFRVRGASETIAPAPTAAPTELTCDVDVITTTKACYEFGEEVEVTFSQCAPATNDWVAVYPNGEDVNDLGSDYKLWVYTTGTQSKRSATPAVGSLSLGALSTGTDMWPIDAGSYQAHLILTGRPYTSKAASLAFRVAAEGSTCATEPPTEAPVPTAAPCANELITTSKSCYAVDEPIEVAFTQCTPVAGDWIGVYTDGAATLNLGNDYKLWLYTSGTQSSGIGSPAFATLSMGSSSSGTDEWPLEIGNYQAHLVFDGSPYVSKMATASFRVVADAASCLPPTAAPIAVPTAAPIPEPTSAPSAAPCTTATAITTDQACYDFGEPIVVDFAQCGGVSGDWIGIYPDGENTGDLGSDQLNWMYTTGDRSREAIVNAGTFTFDSVSPDAADWPLQPGVYQAHLIAEGRPYISKATTFTFRVTPSGTTCALPSSPPAMNEIVTTPPAAIATIAPIAAPTPSTVIEIGKSCFDFGEPIDVDFNQRTNDFGEWIGIYAEGATTSDLGNDYRMWVYTTGNQNAEGSISEASYSLSDSASGTDTWPLEAGVYEAHLVFEDRPYVSKAVSASFRVAPEGSPCVPEVPSEPTAAPVATPCEDSITLTQNCIGSDTNVLVAFSICEPRDEDWIGIYDANANGGDYASEFPLLWLWTCGTQTCGSEPATGTFELSATAALQFAGTATWPLDEGDDYVAVIARGSDTLDEDGDYIIVKQSAFIRIREQESSCSGSRQLALESEPATPKSEHVSTPMKSFLRGRL